LAERAIRFHCLLPELVRNGHGACMQTALHRRIETLALTALSLAALLGAAPPARAGDCFGGSADLIRLRPGGLRFAGSITAPGASHENVVGPDGLGIRVYDAEDLGHSFLDVVIPAERFITTRQGTRYDGKGSFPGTVKL